MNIEIIKIDDKVFKIYYDILDPNGNPLVVEILDDINDEDYDNNEKG